MPAPLLEGSTATRVRVAGRELVYFGGCDYLGLAHEPRVVAALAEAARENGISPGAARETSGDHVEYGRLEAELAAFLGAPAALVVGEGALANLVAAEGLAGAIGVAVFDAAAHATGRAAARAAGIECLEHPHLAAARAGELARAHAARGVALWTDGAFPTRGATPPLAALLDALPDARACLVVDDAHALGVLGPGGRGSAAALDLADPRALVTGTFSKALGTYGGFVAGARERVDALRARSTTLATTTPPPVALVRATRVALAILRDEPERLSRLRANRARAAAGLARLGLAGGHPELPVWALALADSAHTARAHEALLAAGFLVPRTEYPGDDPPLLLRLVVRSEHSAAEIDGLLAALAASLS